MYYNWLCEEVYFAHLTDTKYATNAFPYLLFIRLKDAINAYLSYGRLRSKRIVRDFLSGGVSISLFLFIGSSECICKFHRIMLQVLSQAYPPKIYTVHNKHWIFRFQFMYSVSLRKLHGRVCVTWFSSNLGLLRRISGSQEVSGFCRQSLQPKPRQRNSSKSSTRGFLPRKR